MPRTTTFGPVSPSSDVKGDQVMFQQTSSVELKVIRKPYKPYTVVFVTKVVVSCFCIVNLQTINLF